MKKFFGCFVLCLLVSSAFGMKRLEPNRGFDDDYGLACKRRRMLSEGQQKELDRKLFEILGETKSVGSQFFNGSV